MPGKCKKASSINFGSSSRPHHFPHGWAIIDFFLSYTNIVPLVEKKFKKSWQSGQACPSIKKVYKVVENSNFLIPYDEYLCVFLPTLAEAWKLIFCDRKQHGNECFRYHGTGRGCQLGDEGHTTLCKSSSCAACSILKTSFQVNLANPGGAWVAVCDFQVFYSTSSSELHASDLDRVFTRHLRRTSTSGWCQWFIDTDTTHLANGRSASYSPNSKIMLLTKVVLGNIYTVNAFEEVKSCPPGYQSVSCNHIVRGRGLSIRSAY